MQLIVLQQALLLKNIFSRPQWRLIVFLFQSDSKERRPPAKRIRLSEGETPERGTRRKLDFDMKELRITDDDDDDHDMQEVPVLVSETVKRAVSAAVRPDHPVTEDKKLEPTVSCASDLRNNLETKPEDNRTVITKSFEGIMTSTVS